MAALGLNLLTGVAGQVSLGHAFFMGAGAYAAAYLGGEPGSNLWGHEPADLDLAARAPASPPALIGIIIAPAAVRVRGLYLGIVTVGLVFIGIHLSRLFPEIAGPAEVGRDFPPLEFTLVEGGDPVVSFDGRRPLAVVRHLGRGEEVPVLPRPAGRVRAGRQEPLSAAAPAGRCRRSATVTSPPR